MKKPVPILIAGPSGVGKSTIIQAISSHFNEIELFKTTTTRKPRSDSDDKYNFVSLNQFQKFIENGNLFEWAKVHDNYYGVEETRLKAILSQGKFPMPANAIDVQGLKAYKKEFPDLISIFITYESIDELPKRLKLTRPNATQNEINTRLASAKQEMTTVNEYQHVVTNPEGKLDETINKIKIILEEELALKE